MRIIILHAKYCKAMWNLLSETHCKAMKSSIYLQWSPESDYISLVYIWIRACINGHLLCLNRTMRFIKIQWSCDIKGRQNKYPMLDRTTEMTYNLYAWETNNTMINCSRDSSKCLRFLCDAVARRDGIKHKDLSNKFLR